MDKPKPVPMIAASQSGVFRTRALPNVSTNPSVILKTPPYSAMSCPIRMRFSCLCMASRMPSEMASMSRISIISPPAGVCVAANGAYTSFSSVFKSGVTAGSPYASCRPASMAALISARIASDSAWVITPSSSINRSKLVTGSLAPQSSINSPGTYLVPEASSWPRIRKVIHSTMTGRGFTRISSARSRRVL